MSLKRCGKSVVELKSNNLFELDEKVLEEILLKPEIKDLRVVVVSVAGTCRSGKSFLLNFFIRYLSSEKTAQQDGSWLGAGDAPLTGFYIDWQDGANRITAGIQLWSEPFIITLNSGEKVVVLLMDTQGVIDSSNRRLDNYTIFTLSILLSSVQIYNLMGNVTEEDFQLLQLFTMFENLLDEKINNRKGHQSLCFLIRDWAYPDLYPYGAAGGEKYLEDRFRITSSMPEQCRGLRNNLPSSFEEVSCFLMPHVGYNFLNPNFRGNIRDIDFNFRDNIIEFVPSIFKTDTLWSKTINGQKITAGKLYEYFKYYSNLFSSNDNLNSLQATIEASLLSAENEARKIYENQMRHKCGPGTHSVPASYILKMHQNCLDKARIYFIGKRTMATQKKIDQHLANLIKNLDEMLPQFEQSNESKLQRTISQVNNVYENIISNINEQQALCLHPQDLETIHDAAVKSAMALYDAQVKTISGFPDTKRVELIQDRYVELTRTNDNNNKDVIKNLFEEYQNRMSTHPKDPPLSEAEFKASHEEALRQYVEKFETQRNRPSQYPSDIYKDELEKIIKEEFTLLHVINQGKIKPEITNSTKKTAKRKKNEIKIKRIQTAEKAVLQKSLHEARLVYEKQLSVECGPAAPGVPAGDIPDLHRKYLDKAREAFTNKRTTALQTEINKQLFKLTKASIEELHRKHLGLAREAFTSKRALKAETEAHSHLDNLIEDLEQNLPMLMKSNLENLQATTEQANKVYESIINNINKNEPLCLHPQDLETFHNDAVFAAMTVYDGQVKPISEKSDPNREELIQGFQNRYVELTIINDTNNKNVVKDIFTEYRNIMDTMLKDPPHYRKLKTAHEEALKQSNEKFISKRNRQSHNINDIYKDELKKTIMDAFCQIQISIKGKSKKIQQI